MASRTIAFLLGILLFEQLPHFPTRTTWLVGAAVACVAVAWRLFAPRSRWRSGVETLLFLSAGLAWAGVRGAWIAADTLPVVLEGRDLTVEGVIIDLPEFSQERTRFDFQPEIVFEKGAVVEFRGRMRLTWYEHVPELHAGERWRFTVRLKRPHSLANPGGFDYERHLFQERIHAVGYVRQDAPPQRLAVHAGFFMDAIRDATRQRIEEALGKNAHSGVLVALAMGDGARITRQEWELFRSTGTTHLMAISGLHVGMVAALAALMVRRVWCWPRWIHWLPAPKAAAIAGLLAAIFYGFFAGFSVPTQRTVITIAAVVGTLFFAQNTRAPRLLAIACWAVLLYDPLAVLAPGFWLSFGAVALILYGMGGRLEKGGLAWRWGKLQWILGIGLLPLLIGFFGNAPLVSPLSNLIAVPWISLVVVPLTLLGSALLWAWQGAGEGLLHLAAWLLGLLWPLLEKMASWVPSVSLPMPPVWVLVCTLIGIVLIVAPRGWPARGVGVLWCLPLLWWQPARPAEGEMWLTLLDVGQGLSAVVETREHLLVFDTGPSKGGDFDMGSVVIEPFLRYRGWRRVDTLVISHGDNDHSGGARSLIAALPIAQILAAAPRELEGISSTPCHQGVAWQWNGVSFKVLHPAQTESDNDGSCVLRVSSARGAVLLTGDIEKSAENQLRLSGQALRARVLVVPHHGSSTSSSADFLDAVQPEMALFSVGYRNRFHFPSAEVVARYDARHIRHLDTAREGAITVRFDPEGRVTSESWRAETLRYWQADESLGTRSALW